MKNNQALEKSVRITLARALAGKEIPRELVTSVAEHVAAFGGASPVRGIDICVHGICFDFYFDPRDWHKVIEGLFNERLRLRKFDYFPIGVVQTDLVKLTAGFEVEELAGLAGIQH